MIQKRRPIPLDHVIAYPDGPLLRVTDLMAFTGFSRPKVIKDIEQGRLQASHLGYRGCYFIGRRDAIAWLQAVGVQAKAS